MSSNRPSKDNEFFRLYNEVRILASLLNTVISLERIDVNSKKQNSIQTDEMAAAREGLNRAMKTENEILLNNLVESLGTFKTSNNEATAQSLNNFMQKAKQTIDNYKTGNPFETRLTEELHKVEFQTLSQQDAELDKKINAIKNTSFKGFSAADLLSAAPVEMSASPIGPVVVPENVLLEKERQKIAARFTEMQADRGHQHEARGHYLAAQMATQFYNKYTATSDKIEAVTALMAEFNRTAKLAKVTIPEDFKKAFEKALNEKNPDIAFNILQVQIEKRAQDIEKSHRIDIFSLRPTIETSKHRASVEEDVSKNKNEESTLDESTRRHSAPPQAKPEQMLRENKYEKRKGGRGRDMTVSAQELQELREEIKAQKEVEEARKIQRDEPTKPKI